MEGNIPSMRFFESEGFRLHRTLVMPGIPVSRVMDVPSRGTVRASRPEDLAGIVALLEHTWEGRDLYEPASVNSVKRFIEGTPAFGFDTLLVLEQRNDIVACLGFWNWSRITRITLQALSLKMRIMGKALVLMRILPRFPEPGDTMKQMMLTLMGWRETEDLAALLRYLNNQALADGIEQIFLVCERDDTVLKSMRGFVHIDTAVHVYVKALQADVCLTDGPVFISGIDV
jgi:N-acetylglutamate synthase-like GNAT family acetyltransferase